MIIDLLLINVSITMIFLSGFIDSVDNFINRKFPPYHLPAPFSCNLCSVFWASLLYTIITGNLSLLSLCLCLFSALLTEVTAPMITIIINWLKKVLMWIMPKDI